MFRQGPGRFRSCLVSVLVGCTLSRLLRSCGIWCRGKSHNSKSPAHLRTSAGSCSSGSQLRPYLGPSWPAQSAGTSTVDTLFGGADRNDGPIASKDDANPCDFSALLWTTQCACSSVLLPPRSNMLALFADTDTRRRPPEWFPAHVCPTPIATDVVEMIPAVATVLNA